MPSIHTNVTRGTNCSCVRIIYDASSYQNDIKLLNLNSKKRKIFTKLKFSLVKRSMILTNYHSSMDSRTCNYFFLKKQMIM